MPWTPEQRAALRIEFALRAPAPPDWFKPTIAPMPGRVQLPPRPAWLAALSDKVRGIIGAALTQLEQGARGTTVDSVIEESWALIEKVEQTKLTRDEVDGSLRAYHQAYIEAANAIAKGAGFQAAKRSDDAERLGQWPWAYADLVLGEGEPV